MAKEYSKKLHARGLLLRKEKKIFTGTQSILKWGFPDNKIVNF